jgi:hypothetical protein
LAAPGENREASACAAWAGAALAATERSGMIMKPAKRGTVPIGRDQSFGRDTAVESIARFRHSTVINRPAWRQRVRR